MARASLQLALEFKNKELPTPFRIALARRHEGVAEATITESQASAFVLALEEDPNVSFVAEHFLHVWFRGQDFFAVEDVTGLLKDLLAEQHEHDLKSTWAWIKRTFCCCCSSQSDGQIKMEVHSRPGPWRDLPIPTHRTLLVS